MGRINNDELYEPDIVFTGLETLVGSDEDGTTKQFSLLSLSGYFGGEGAPAWGDITGTLSDQTDLQTALDGKAGLASNNNFTGVINTFANNAIVQGELTMDDNVYFKDRALTGVDAKSGHGIIAAKTNSVWLLSRIGSYQGANLDINSVSGDQTYQFPPTGGTFVLKDTIISASQFRLAALNNPPNSAVDTGTLGEIRIDANFIYVCTATNTWKRVAIATW